MLKSIFIKQSHLKCITELNLIIYKDKQSEKAISLFEMITRFSD